MTTIQFTTIAVAKTYSTCHKFAQSWNRSVKFLGSSTITIPASLHPGSYLFIYLSTTLTKRLCQPFAIRLNTEVSHTRPHPTFHILNLGLLDLKPVRPTVAGSSSELITIRIELKIRKAGWGGVVEYLHRDRGHRRSTMVSWMNAMRDDRVRV